MEKLNVTRTSINTTQFNETCLNQTVTPLTADTLFYAYYYGIFVILTVINIPGNLMVICTILRHNSLRQPANFFMVSLAVSDLLLAVMYPLYNISHLEHVPSIYRPLGE